MVVVWGHVLPRTIINDVRRGFDQASVFLMECLKLDIKHLYLVMISVYYY